jgi:hypothetical protein
MQIFLLTDFSLAETFSSADDKSMKKLRIPGLHNGSEPMLNCGSPLLTIIFIITLSLGVTESVLWVPPPQKWDLDLCKVGRSQDRSSQAIPVALDTNEPS